jgi:serine beta-lactamase-like protein LACTB, mitochondrial
MLSRRNFVLGTTASAFALSVARAAHASGADAVRAIAQQMMAANPLPSLSIAVVQNDDLIFAEAFGKVDLELGTPATPAHRYRLGSVAKVITATVAAQLASKQVVDLDAGIARYLPDLPEHHRATTLRQLLTHRGGVRHYEKKDSAPGVPGPIDQRLYKSNADILAVFIDDPLVAKPGERVSYSTFGYTLASLVLEGAAKAPFLDLVRREVASPLGLTTLGPDDPIALVPDRVRGYHPAEILKNVNPDFGGQWGNIPSNNPTYKWAGGGMLATPADLARFGAAHFAPGKLARSTLHILFTVYTEKTERSPPLGLGWRIDQDATQRLRWHHAGGQDGARASLVVYPKQRLSIALATNVTATPGDVNGPSAKIADAVIAS